LLYAAADPALAVLEVRVQLDLPPDLVPRDYVLVEIDFDALAVESLSEMPADPRAYGDTWLYERRTPLLRVPSVIVAESANLLFNPAHAAASAARIVRKRSFSFDPRLWLSP